MSVINIGGKLVGPGHPTFVLAEVGSNHNRDLAMAKQLIDAAVDAGADAVKFQTFSAKTLYSKYTPKFSYLEAQGEQKDTYSIIEDAELPREWQSILIDYAKEKGILFISTPTDRAGVDELDALGVPAFKISSYEAVDLPFVRYVASKGKPLIISTGMCSEEEIHDIWMACREKGNPQVALLQCTSLYPAPVHLANLKAVHATARQFYDVDGLRLWGTAVTGLSDHTPGIHIPIAAVAMGACIIEKHFTLDRNLPGPDHRHSLEPHELKAMVQQIRDVEAAMGNGRKIGPAPEEMEMYQKARRSVVAAVDITAGTVITEAMVTSKRPGHGIPARDIEQVIGRAAQADIREDEVILWQMLFEHNNYEDSAPLGVFESHVAAVAHILANYGPFDGMDDIEPDRAEVYVHPDRYWHLHLTLYRLPLGDARVLDVAVEDCRTRLRSEWDWGMVE